MVLKRQGVHGSNDYSFPNSHVSSSDKHLLIACISMVLGKFYLSLMFPKLFYNNIIDIIN